MRWVTGCLSPRKDTIAPVRTNPTRKAKERVTSFSNEGILRRRCYVDAWFAVVVLAGTSGKSIPTPKSDPGMRDVCPPNDGVISRGGMGILQLQYLSEMLDDPGLPRTTQVVKFARPDSEA
jgi:hypothetical protein